MDIRKKAIEFIEELDANKVLQIPHRSLKTSASEFLKTIDQRTIPPFMDYLIETGLIKQVYGGKNPAYSINYERKEQLKDPNFKWLNANSIEEEVKGD